LLLAAVKLIPNNSISQEVFTGVLAKTGNSATTNGEVAKSAYFSNPWQRPKSMLLRISSPQLLA
jgi:hypothetical protein